MAERFVVVADSADEVDFWGILFDCLGWTWFIGKTGISRDGLIAAVVADINHPG